MRNKSDAPVPKLLVCKVRFYTVTNPVPLPYIEGREVILRLPYEDIDPRFAELAALPDSSPLVARERDTQSRPVHSINDTVRWIAVRDENSGQWVRHLG